MYRSTFYYALSIFAASMLHFCFSVTSLVAQKVELNYDHYPLNEVLLDLNDRYGLPFSIDAEKASSCLISLEATFPSLDQALEVIVRQCAFDFKILNGVYTFYTKEVEPGIAESKENFLFYGKILDKWSYEPLPYAHIIVNDQLFIANQYGQFSIEQKTERLGAHISSLGYQKLDTLLAPKPFLEIYLEPISLRLSEITIEEQAATRDVGYGPAVAEYRFNDVQQQLVPGLNANTVFNHLRMLPGVLASAEAVADYVIWGSYSGQNHTVYDGITLFSNQGISKDIGRLNPYMVKNIQIINGGYQVDKGDRIAGFIQIDGKQGSVENLHTQAALTNQLALGYANLPFKSIQSSLQIAGRFSYFDMYDIQSSNASPINVIEPSYNFSDYNLKWSSLLNRNTYLNLSWLSSTDSYGLNNESLRLSGPPTQNNRLFGSNLFKINAKQDGTSVRLHHLMESGRHFEAVYSWSQYSPSTTTSRTVFLGHRTNMPTQGNTAPILNDTTLLRWENPIQEQHLQLNYSLPDITNQSLSFSVGWYQHEATSTLSALMEKLTAPNTKLNRFFSYSLYRFVTPNNTTIEGGLRFDWASELNKGYIQPRISISTSLNQQWKALFSAGIYKQFVGLHTVFDENSNRSLIWQTAKENQVPVIHAEHIVGSLQWQKASLQASITAFSKQLHGMNRYIALNRVQTAVLEGESKAHGIDLWLAKQSTHWNISIAYSLSEVYERYRAQSNYIYAPQDQRHELKWMGQLLWSNIQFSLSQSFGSGLAIPFRQQGEIRFERSNYRRTDIAIEIDQEIQKHHFKLGFSAINLFDHVNYRLNGNQNITDGQILNTLGLPRTFNLYLKWQFRSTR